MISTSILKLDSPKCFIDQKGLVDGGVVALLIVTTETDDVFAPRIQTYPVLDSGEVLDTPCHLGVLTKSIKRGSVLYDKALNYAITNTLAKDMEEFEEDCFNMGLNII